MIGKLMTLSLRVSLKTTSLAFRGALELTQTAVGAGEQLISLLRHDGGDDRSQAPSPPREAASRDDAEPPHKAAERDTGDNGGSVAPRAARESAVAPEPPSSDVPRRDPRRPATTNGSEPPVADPRPARTEPPAELRQNVVDLDAPPEPLIPEADHVSEETTLVEERSDPGAEDGAGAQIRIAEPFEGYGALKAQDVVARVSTATEAELTAIRLYEGTHRNRQTILRAVDRRFAQIQNDHH